MTNTSIFWLLRILSHFLINNVNTRTFACLSQAKWRGALYKQIGYVSEYLSENQALYLLNIDYKSEKDDISDDEKEKLSVYLGGFSDFRNF